jgi:hypothetical protein
LCGAAGDGRKISILVDEIVRTSSIFYKIADNMEACCRPTGSIRLIYVSRASLDKKRESPYALENQKISD